MELKEIVTLGAALVFGWLLHYAQAYFSKKGENLTTLQATIHVWSDKSK